MRSIGFDLQAWVDAGLLRIHATRPSTHGLEAHLVMLHKLVADFQPRAVVVDPITGLLAVGNTGETRAMLVRLIDHLKSRDITALYTDLTHGRTELEATAVHVSSLIDTWLLVRTVEVNGERNRILFMLKSRGMGHSNQVREFLLTDQGIELREAYLGRQGVLTGSARLVQEAEDRDAEERRAAEARRQAEELAVKRRLLEARMQEIEAELSANKRDLEIAAAEQARVHRVAADDERAMARSRGTNGRTPNP